MPKPSRVIIASNRLPVLLNPDGTHRAAPAAGGLATGLRAFHQRGESIWIGWSGCAPEGGDRFSEVADETARRRIVGVTLSRERYKRYYDGMCNAVLWPVFHSQTERVPFADADWESYRAVNERFASAIAREYRPGDAIWVHDYHLLLVPRLLRKLVPDAAIGFFLHVPFPAPDVFRAVPWRRELLDGMLAATVVGFHTASYADHFREAARALLADRPGRGRFRDAYVGVYPMGIDVAAFSGTAPPPPVHHDANGGRRGDPPQILLGVDRLDYTKGIPQRLMAYDRLLRNRPDLRGRVRLIQVAVPSRERVASYKALRRQVEELVGRINGEHGTVDWTPVQYVRQSIPPPQLIALYRQADVMLVTPVRDGMNLVAKEFVASRVDGDGVLVLSEFAGAADQLKDAITVNAYSVEQMAAAVATALDMKPAERRRRMAALRASVEAQDVHWWAAQFLADLRGHETESHVAPPAKSISFWPFAMVRSRLRSRARPSVA